MIGETIDKSLASHIDMAWYWYFKQTDTPVISGKFMTYGSGSIPKSLQETILEALESGITPRVKHSNPDTLELNPHGKNGQWVVIWYSSDQRTDLQKLARFLIGKGLVRKTAKGKLYNISFKYETQTAAGEYGADYQPAIKLDDLIDLYTGELLL